MKKIFFEVINMKKAALVLAFFVCVFGFSTPKVMAEQPLDTVSISGYATRTVAPDMATVTFTYETTGDTVEAVRQEGAVISNRVISKVLSMGIPMEDLATTRYNVAPYYTYERNGRQKLNGYRLYATWTAKVKDLKQLGTVTDSLLGIGVNRIDSISYGVQQADVYRRQLMSEAVANARLNAQAIANAGGRGLGALRQASVTQSNFEMQASPRIMLAKANDTAGSAPTELVPKPYTISVTVNTVFAME
jgi:uncharacterized protein YggE